MGDRQGAAGYGREVMVHKPVKEMTKMERWLAYFANKLNQKEREGLAMLNPEISEATDASECSRRPI